MKFPIPKSAFDDRVSIVGMSGSGKTYTASSAVEQLLEDNARVVIVDPLGVWWGLRLRADGKTPAFDLPIFGGEHGDLALTEGAGALIGETVAGAAQSCIIDLSQIGTKAGERRFMLAFLTALYRGINGAQVHVIFDEADMWAPQRLLDKDGDAARLLGMMETLVRRGRARGFIPWLITQRPAVLSKDVLSQSDGIIAMKLTASQDREAIGAWIEGQADKADGKAILASLPRLPRGCGVAWFPAREILETVEFPLKQTFDSSRAPKRGETRPNAVLSAIDIGKLRQRLSSVEADVKANDPKALRAEIARLKANVGKDGARDAENLRAIETAYQNGRADGIARCRDAFQDAIGRMTDRNISTAMDFEQAMRDLERAAPPRPPAKAGEGHGRAPAPSQRPAAANAQVPAAARPAPVPADADGLTKSQRRVMASLGFWRSVGHDRPTREQVAAVAGYKAGSGNFNNIVSSLNTGGMVTLPEPGRLSSRVAVTSPLSQDQAKATIMSILAGPQRKVVDVIVSGGIRDFWQRDEIASGTGYSPGSGNFNNILSSLTVIDIIRRAGTGRVVLSDWAREVLA